MLLLHKKKDCRNDNNSKTIIGIDRYRIDSYELYKYICTLNDEKTEMDIAMDKIWHRYNVIILAFNPTFALKKEKM